MTRKGTTHHKAICPECGRIIAAKPVRARPHQDPETREWKEGGEIIGYDLYSHVDHSRPLERHYGHSGGYHYCEPRRSSSGELRPEAFLSEEDLLSEEGVAEMIEDEEEERALELWNKMSGRQRSRIMRIVGMIRMGKLPIE